MFFDHCTIAARWRATIRGNVERRDQGTKKPQSENRMMLIGERIYLRAIEERDVADRVRSFNDPDVRAELHLVYPFSEVATREWLRRVAVDERRKDFVACLLENDQTIGFLGIVDIDWRHAKAGSYIVIGEKQYWGQGYGKEAQGLLIEYGFRELRLNRMYAWTTNERIVRLKKSLGYRVEGLLREDIYSGGQFHDRTFLGITAGDYLSLRAGHTGPRIESQRRAS
jgi:RimJ/RimL family protein N-acetyltransferase